MNDYIVVFHSWFVSSNYFEEKIIQAENIEQAHEKASRICHIKNNRGIDKWDYYIVKAEKEIKVTYKKSWYRFIINKIF